MDAYSVLPIVALPCAALVANRLCLAVSDRLAPGDPVVFHARYGTLDGLRGFLALFVFVHHGAVWLRYDQIRVWTKPSSDLYTNMGDTSVALFFMITAFLFVGQVLDKPPGTMNWKRLYVARVLRIAPMYLVVICAMFLDVGVRSGWTLQTSPGALAKGVVSWLTFSFNGRVDLNGIRQTRYIIAGVTWTLAYEWLFYLFLPVVALLARRRPPAWTFLVCALAALLAAVLQPESRYVAPFAGGFAAAAAVRMPALQRWARSPWASVAVCAGLTWQMTTRPTAFEPLSVLVLGVVFSLVACGTSIFGLLTTRACRFFGEPAYSVYLLHGLLLHLVFFHLIGPERAAQLTPLEHWGVVLAVTPVLVVAARLGYHFVERPFTNPGRRPRGAPRTAKFA